MANESSGIEATPAEEMDFQKDEVGDEGRDWLLQLLSQSTYDGRVRDRLEQRINGILTNEEYEKAKTDLMNNQAGFDAIVNPSQTDIKKHLKKIIK